MKVLWMSRHQPLQSQLDELDRIFGGCEVVQDPKPFEDASDIQKRYEDGGYDEIVVVAPLSVIAKLTEAGLRPLWAEMETIDESEFNPYDSVRVNDRIYRFRGFKRIKRVALEFEPL